MSEVIIDSDDLRVERLGSALIATAGSRLNVSWLRNHDKTTLVETMVAVEAWFQEVRRDPLGLSVTPRVLVDSKGLRVVEHADEMVATFLGQSVSIPMTTHHHDDIADALDALEEWFDSLRGGRYPS